MINFPASPAIDDEFTDSGITWKWDGIKWIPFSVGTPGPQGPQGPPGAQGPQGPNGIDGVDVTGGYGQNLIINGDMRIDQRRNGSAANTGNNVGYFVDHWLWINTGGAVGVASSGRNMSGPPTSIDVGFPYWLGLQTVTGGGAPGANDFYGYLQIIEADLLTELQWGTPDAKPVTLSFWTYSNQAFTFGGSISSRDGLRSYPFSYQQQGSIWTRSVVTIPGDTTNPASWPNSGNLPGLRVCFSLGCGTNFVRPAGAWANGNFWGATGEGSILAAVNRIWGITGVKLEIGSTPTPFVKEPLAKSMADCQRYYQTCTRALWNGCLSNVANQNYTSWQSFYVPMRGVPTITMINVSNVIFPATIPTRGYLDEMGFEAYKTFTGTANTFGQFVYSWTAQSELG